MEIKGWIPDFESRSFFYGSLEVENSIISSIKRIGNTKEIQKEHKNYILPGMIDAHVHIESSMLIPSRFAAEALKHGTVACVSDPHEIANVLGREGIEFMFEDADRTPLKIFFTAPSCVPATNQESSGSILDSVELGKMLDDLSFVALGEMMNYPGVINEDEEVLRKIDLFLKRGKKVDGHAPGLRGSDLKKYIDSGISTDHEAVTIDEAREKIMMGMKILIREGSAARNFEKLWPLIEEHTDMVMLCCDDIHPDELLKHHINHLVIRGLEKGLNIFDLLKVSSINPVNHYGLDVGTLREGDKADFILVDDIDKFEILESYIEGERVYKRGISPPNIPARNTPNNFNRKLVRAKDFEMPGKDGNYKVIGAIDGDLYTTSENHFIKSEKGSLVPDNEKDIIRISVVNRYKNTTPALGWIKNTGLRKGAIASSIAHDSHNIIVMGVRTEDMAASVNMIIEQKGGISVSKSDYRGLLPLKVAGLMSTDSAQSVGEKYEELNNIAREWGSSLSAPFMTLSFMALLVIPELKIGDRGLFDVKEFKFVEQKSS